MFTIDRVYVINLKRSIDRRKEMIVTLSRMNVPRNKIVFVEATDGVEQSWRRVIEDFGINWKDFLDAGTWNKIKSGNKRVRGQIGNFLSHLRIWDMIGKMKKYGRYLILEDDVCPTSFWFQTRHNMGLLSRVSAEFVYFGDCFRWGRGSVLVNGRWNSLIRTPAECLHAYMVTTNFGRIIRGSTENIFPLKLPSDHWVPEFLVKNSILFCNFKNCLLIQKPETSAISNIGYGEEDSDPSLKGLSCHQKSTRSVSYFLGS